MENNFLGEKKIILVTGGAGFIGSNLCERLVSEGHEVISLDDYSFGSTENHVSGVTYYEGHTKDISKTIKEIPDIIFHLGEYSRVEQSFSDVDKVTESNMVGTKAVLEYWRNTGCKLVYAGSSTKFGEEGKSQSPYSWTKATNTDLVQNYANWFNLPFAITYFYNVYGPKERGDDSTGTLVGIYAERKAQNLPLQVRLPGTQSRNFTHVSDIVDGLLLVGAFGTGDEYGIGHPDAYSVNDVAEMFGGEIETVPNRPGNRTIAPVNADRTIKLGWEPKYNLPTYIKNIV